VDLAEVRGLGGGDFESYVCLNGLIEYAMLHYKYFLNYGQTQIVNPVHELQRR
jgi:hypothetical protein